MNIVLDFGRYVARLVTHQRVSSVLAIVTLVLTVASAGARHSIGMPAWAWMLVTFLAVLYSAFAEWRDTLAVTEAEQVMEADHQQWLQGILATVRQSVRSELPCRFADGDRENAARKAAFEAHFPELIDLATSWDSQLAMVEIAANACNHAIDKAAGEQWDRPWGVASYVSSYVTRYLCERHAPSPRWDFIDDGDAGGRVVQHKDAGGTVTMRMLPPLASLADKQAAMWEVNQLNDFTRHQLDSPEAKEWRKALGQRDDIQKSLLSQLEGLLPPNKLRQRRCGEGCLPR